jgi:PKD repeat protein
MRLLFTTLLLLLAHVSFGQQTIQAFFVGNSYTGVNNLPQLIANVTASTGDSLAFSSNLIGGATLQNHAGNTNTLTPIQNGNWDYVIIQAQSQEPSFPIAQVQTNTFPYAQALNDSIEKYQPCGETMFYMTWGRENGDASNCQFFPPLCTYEGMDSMLRLRYEMMANAYEAELSPVGAVWRYIRTNHPNIDLYTSDGSHPSAAGSYAAACTFYTSMFRKDPTAITFDFSLTAADALTIRNAAKTIVFDDLLTWNIGAYDPMANFTFTTLDSTDFVFTNISMNADGYSWDFGDGNTSSLANPTNTYSNSGDYTVTLSVFSCGDTATFSDTITVYAVHTMTVLDENLFRLFPNPNSGIIDINTTINDFSIKVYNQIGQLVLETKSNRIDISNQVNGVYYVSIEFEGNRLQKKVLKF